jgi:hypothetical protein
MPSGTGHWRERCGRGSEGELRSPWPVASGRRLVVVPELVDAALARVQTALPATAKVTANRLTFAAFPIMGYSLTSDTIPHHG